MYFRASVFSTASQPKALTATSDNTTFVVGSDAVEAVRHNQKIADFRPGVNPTAISAVGSLLAIGFGVRNKTGQSAHAGVFAHPRHLSIFFRIRKFGCMTGMARRSKRLAF
jgi:hypothetical protein